MPDSDILVCGFLTICLAVVIVAFTVPKIYELKKTEIDQVCWHSV